MSPFSDLLPFAFFVVALVYSSVGFAGGSSYLLVLTLAGFTHPESAPIALLCNLIVSSVGSFARWKRGDLRFRLLLPFLAASIPAAFLGARIPASKSVFLLLLSGCLAFAALRIFWLRENARPLHNLTEAQKWRWGLPAGGVMGFFSGLVGIGGGIFLSPFLMLTRLASFKEAAAAASFFIFLNSLSGFVAKMPAGIHLTADCIPLALASLAGGLIGTRVGTLPALETKIPRVLAALLLYLATNMAMKAFA